MGKPLKIFVYSMDSAGHINACVGLAQTLAKRGHRIYLLLNDQFKAQYVQYGFELILLHYNNNNNNSEDSTENGTKSGTENGTKNGTEVTTENTTKNDEQNDEHKSPFIELANTLQKAGILGPDSPLEKLKALSNKEFSAPMKQKVIEINPQIETAIRREQPDVIIIDQMFIPPAVKQANIPWILISSCTPLLLHKSPLLPPPFSGYPTNGDRSDWPMFHEVFNQWSYDDLVRVQKQLDAHFGYEPTNEEKEHYAKNSSALSPYLNIYGYPAELDYDDVVSIPDHLARVDSFCRYVPKPFELPSHFDYDPSKDKLIYFSMGSMGSVDVKLMKRISGILARTPHKYIVSKGPRADEYQLPVNCWGDAYLPQTRILPMVDLVITHGGNNTVTESFTFGKPMIVMPLFCDQYDNAQRIVEKGYGIRMEPYTFDDQQLMDAIDQLLYDTELAERLNAAVKRIEKSQSKEKVSERIEQIVREHSTAAA